MHRTTWHERARGLMAGIAAGNILGIEQEGWSRERIAAAYPDGVGEIDEDIGPPDDDDLAQALIIAEAAERGPLDPDDLGRRFWAWAETNGRGIGHLTSDVLALYGGDRPRCLGAPRGHGVVRAPAGVPIIEASRTAWQGSRAGNGAAMRTAPIAIRWRDDPVALVRNSIVSAVPTHWDPGCGWSCVLLNLAAASALAGEWMTADELLAAAGEGIRASLPELEPYGYEAEAPHAVRHAVQEASGIRPISLARRTASARFVTPSLANSLRRWWRTPCTLSPRAAAISLSR